MFKEALDWAGKVGGAITTLILLFGGVAAATEWWMTGGLARVFGYEIVQKHGSKEIERAWGAVDTESCPTGYLVIGMLCGPVDTSVIQGTEAIPENGRWRGRCHYTINKPAEAAGKRILATAFCAPSRVVTQ